MTLPLNAASLPEHGDHCPDADYRCGCGLFATVASVLALQDFMRYATAAPGPVLMLEPRHDYPSGGGWSRHVVYRGTQYVVGVERGRAARIAFKPRGRNLGWHWCGFVRNAAGRQLWSGRVGKSVGVRGLLQYAGIWTEHVPKR